MATVTENTKILKFAKLPLFQARICLNYKSMIKSSPGPRSKPYWNVQLLFLNKGLFRWAIQTQVIL
jgi:hypothetical protein